MRGCLVVAAVLVAAAPPLQAHAAPDASAFSALSRDVPGYKTEGAQVKGTASSGQAPTLKPGIFTDTIGVGEKKFYGVDLDDVSSAFISAFALPEPGSKVGHGDGLNVELESSTGTGCNSGSRFTFGADGAARPIGDYASRKISRELACQESGHYLFSVERQGNGASGPWPVEIRYMLEPGLKKGTVPEPFAPAPSTSPAPPTGEAEQIKGGTGFNDAVAAGTGVWKDRILPGQTLFYRVPVDWGQRLFATTEFANAENVTDDAGFSSNGLRAEVYNPARGEVTSDAASYDGDQSATGVGTQRADYTNRLESDSALSAMRFSGWYYLAVSMHPDVAEFVDGGVDVTLRVAVEGRAEEGPEYAGDAAAAGFGVSEDAFDGGAGSAADTKTLIAYGAFGTGGTLLAALLLWTLAARRRAPVAPTDPGRPGGPPAPDVPTESGGYPDPRGGGPGAPPHAGW